MKPHKPPLRLSPEHLKIFRKTFGLSQDAAATGIGLSRVQWNRWEQGKAPIPDHMVYTLRGFGQELKEVQ